MFLDIGPQNPYDPLDVLSLARCQLLSYRPVVLAVACVIIDRWLRPHDIRGAVTSRESHICWAKRGGGGVITQNTWTIDLNQTTDNILTD